MRDDYTDGSDPLTRRAVDPPDFDADRSTASDGDATWLDDPARPAASDAHGGYDERGANDESESATDTPAADSGQDDAIDDHERSPHDATHLGTDDAAVGTDPDGPAGYDAAGDHDETTSFGSTTADPVDGHPVDERADDAAVVAAAGGRDDDLKPARRPSGWRFFGIFVIGLVAALLIGWFTGILAGKMFGPETEDTTATEPTETAPTEDPQQPTEGAPEPGQPIAITSSTLFDPPPGDGEENPDRIDLTHDGQPGTTWPTLQYKSTPTFGNIKPGVGIIYDLGSEQTVSAVKITTTIPGSTVEIRSGTGTTGTIDDFPVVGGPTELQTNTEIAVNDGTSTRYVLVWITELVPQQGYFQASLSEVEIVS